MKRKIPIFKVSIAPGASYSALGQIPDVKQAVMEETLYAIRYAISKKKKSIPLFEVADSQYYITLEKNKWVISLQNKLLPFFVEKEDYDKCIQCRDLISQLSIK